MEKNNKRTAAPKKGISQKESGVGDFEITTKFVQEELTSILERVVEGKDNPHDAADDIMQFTSRSQILSASERQKLLRKHKSARQAADLQPAPCENSQEPEVPVSKKVPKPTEAQKLQDAWNSSDEDELSAYEQSLFEEESLDPNRKLSRKERREQKKREKQREKEHKKQARQKNRKDKSKPGSEAASNDEDQQDIQKTGKLNEENASDQKEPEAPKRRFLFDEPKEESKKKEDSSESEPDQGDQQNDQNKESQSSTEFRTASEIYGTTHPDDMAGLWSLPETKQKEEWGEKLWNKYKAHVAKKKYFGFPTTVMLLGLLFVLVVGISALFVTGPANLHAEKVAKAEARIEQQVPEIRGLTRNTFAYITYEGYTDDTLYWFDVTGELITSKPMQSLNYENAKKRAIDVYGITPVTIQLAYGYTAPAYEIQGEDHLLLLDYDTLSLVYERRNWK